MIKKNYIIFISLLLITSCIQDKGNKYILEYNIPIGQEFSYSNASVINYTRSNDYGMEKKLYTVVSNKYNFECLTADAKNNTTYQLKIALHQVHLNEDDDIITYNSYADTSKLSTEERILHNNISTAIDTVYQFKLNPKGKVIDNIRLTNNHNLMNEYIDLGILFNILPDKAVYIGDQWTINSQAPGNGLARSFTYKLQQVDSLHYYIDIVKMSAPKFQFLKKLKTTGQIILDRKDCSLIHMKYSLSTLGGAQKERLSIVNDVETYYHQ